jgi:hypothetical protein
MRKIYKRKKRACGLCKPHKRGWTKWIDGKELQELKEFEKTKTKFLVTDTEFNDEL